MSNFKCPFCGSKERFLDTPFVELNEKGEYETKRTFCCEAQKRNFDYVEKNFLPDAAPDIDEVAKI